MARPRNKPNQNRIPFQVRLLPSERREVEVAAKTTGMSVSTWMRVECLKAAKLVRAAA